MPFEIILILVIVCVAIILFATEIISIDLTAITVMVLLMLTGLVTPQEGISGFSNTATVTIMALFILSAGLQATGAVNLLGRYLTLLIGRSKGMALGIIMLVVGLVSALINNTAVVIIFIPIVFRIAKFTGSSASKYLMPLSFAAMIGGACTVIGTSTNILVSEIYAEHSDTAGFGIFEFLPIGAVIFIVFMLYMLLLGDRLISDRKQTEELTEQYHIKDYLTEIQITPGSPLINKHLNHTFLVEDLNADILEVRREEGDRKIFLPDTHLMLKSGDIILLKVGVEDILNIQNTAGVVLKSRKEFGDEDLESNETTLIEVLIAPNSKIARKKVRDVNFKGLYGAVPLAIRRRGTTLKESIGDVVLRFGDDVLLEARKDSIQGFDRTFDFILTQEITKPHFERSKLILSSVIVAGVVLAAALNITHILIASLTGCVLMFLTKCITIREAYRNIEWKIIFLLAGLLPLGIAMEKWGAGELIANNLFHFIGNFGDIGAIALLFILTSMLTSIMSNNATAILMAPIAIGLSANMGVDPRGLLITIMFAANTSFITPVGYQTNTLIYGPGNYRFTDFLKVGGLLTVIIWVLVTFMVHWIYF